MKIEFLFPELANQFGEIGHQRFLRQLFPHAEVICTQLLQKPAFLEEKVDLIYMGPSSETAQEKIINVLMPYKDGVRERIEEGDHFLFIGNAMEVLGTSILQEDGEAIEALDIFPMQARRQMMNRLTDLYVGIYDELKVTGVKSQFTQNYPKDEEAFPYLFHTLRGFGMHQGISGEGIHYHNFVATYLTGPLLIMNPLFTERLLGEWGLSAEIPHKKTLVEAYTIRLAEYENPQSYT
ncbi:MAG TPA: hypothetical protein GX733_06745 [Tissierellia bacterium]|jgi:CobQ-like glutamine amidotransferase family enzyme|nr:hypothetical protein [Tissierellia bacterium]